MRLGTIGSVPWMAREHLGTDALTLSMRWETEFGGLANRWELEMNRVSRRFPVPEVNCLCRWWKVVKCQANGGFVVLQLEQRERQRQSNASGCQRLLVDWLVVWLLWCVLVLVPVPVFSPSQKLLCAILNTVFHAGEISMLMFLGLQKVRVYTILHSCVFGNFKFTHQRVLNSLLII